MKKYFRLLLSFGLVLSLILSLSITSFASLKDLMIATDSNALMTLELDGTDYLLMSPRSSVGTVENTVKQSQVIIACTNGTYDYNRILEPQLVNGRFDFNFTMPDGFEGYWIRQVDFFMKDDSTGVNGLPPNGIYDFSFDFSSDFSFAHPYSNPLYSVYEPKNTAPETSYYNLDGHLYFNSGDMYIAPFAINIRNNVEELRIITMYYQTDQITNFAGSYAMRFVESNSSSGVELAGSNSSSDNYENDVSSSLSDLSSSVDTMTDEISGVTDAIQNLQGAMEPHYSNVLTQLHHITEQLHAFYDQIYNNIHLKEYALWQDIKTAIENIDLEVNVNLDKLKMSIDNMSTAIQNKLQSVQEAITNGFDNQGINQDAAELDQSLQEYEEAEQTVLDQVNDSLDDFEFDSGFDEYKTTISVFSDFLQDLYDSSGGFKVVINLSLMLSIAGIVIGVYRFRDGG